MKKQLGVLMFTFLLVIGLCGAVNAVTIDLPGINVVAGNGGTGTGAGNGAGTGSGTGAGGGSAGAGTGEASGAGTGAGAGNGADIGADARNGANAFIGELRVGT